MRFQEELDLRLGEILEVLLAIARQDFNVRAAVRGTEDVLDAIAVGLNMLAEELGMEVASRRELERAHAELKRAQAQLVHSGKLAAVGQLASGVAHEINNPATSLEAALTIVRRSCDDLSTKLLSSEREVLGAAREAVADAQEAVSRIRRLTGDIRTFARADDEALRPLRLDEVVDVSCRLAAPMVRPRAELVLKLLPVPTVLGNRGRLGQVVTNLLVNAAQAVPEEAPTAQVVAVSTFERDGKAVLRVEDSGPGVPPELHDRIFEPFFTTKPEGAGTGLGLSLVSEIVLAHHGTIDVSSSDRGGACFDVSLPAVPDVAVPPSSPAQTTGPIRARVLLVDDEAMIVRLLGSLLSDRCDVVSANSGNEAIGILERDHAFDVILCDLHMRETDGIDVYEAVQRVAPSLLKRFVFTTGGAVTARGRAFLDRNDPRILPKPFRVDELFSLISELISSPLPSP